MRIRRGGSWIRGGANLEVHSRGSMGAAGTSREVGFRCVSGAASN